jgi:osmotically-inducible protein OsmY
MSVEDARMSMNIRHEIVKRAIDSSRLEVRVCHGVVYLSGEIRELRGGCLDLRKEMEILHHVLRGKPGIRDVIDETHSRMRVSA